MKSEIDLMLDLFEVSEECARPAGAAKRASVESQENEADRDGDEPSEWKAKVQSKMLQTVKLAEIGMNFAGMVHELRQPMTGIYGFAQLIADRPDSPNVVTWANEIISQSERMKEMIERLRHFCGTNELKEVRWLSPAEAIDDAMKLIPKLRHGLFISIQIPKSPDLAIRADKSALTQIFWNLLLNACDSMATPVDQNGLPTFQKGEIRVEFRHTPDGRGIFSVSDQGKGIPEGLQERIFEPFTTTKGVQGTGLGLFICNNLATSMGATLTVTTAKPPFRTTFELAFPPESVR